MIDNLSVVWLTTRSRGLGTVNYIQGSIMFENSLVIAVQYPYNLDEI